MNKQNSFLKRFGMFIAFLFLILLLFVALLPTIVSTRWGRETLVSLVNHEIPGHLTVNTLSLSWIGPQTVEGIVLNDPENKKVLTLERCSLEDSLFTLLRRGFFAGDFNLQSLNLILDTDEKGITNLQRTLDKSCCAQPNNSPSAPTIALNDVNAVLNVNNSGEEPMTIKASGITKQGELQGNFEINGLIAGLTLDQLSRSKESIQSLLKQNPQAKIMFQATINNFPVEIIDQIASFGKPSVAGMMAELIGPVLNATVENRLTSEGLSLSLQANSDHLKAQAVAQIDQSIVIRQPAKVSLTLSPAVLKHLLAIENVHLPWEILSDANLTVEINSLEVPLTIFEKPLLQTNFSPVGVSATIDIAPFTIENKSKKLNLGFTNFRLSADTKSGEPTVQIEVHAAAGQNGTPMKVDFKTALPKNLNTKELLNTWLKQLEVQGKLSRIPLAAVDDFLELNGLLPLTLGPFLDASFSTQPNGDSTIASLSFRSDRLQIDQLNVMLEDYITLSQPAYATLVIEPHLFAKIIPKGPQLAQPVNARVSLHSLTIPFFKEKIPDLNEIHAIADISLADMKLQQLPQVGDLSVKEFMVNIDATPLSKPQIKVKSHLTQKEPGIFQKVVGENLKLELESKLHLFEDEFAMLQNFDMKINSELINASLAGVVRGGNRLLIKTPTQIDYTLTTAGLQSLGLSPSEYALLEGQPLQFTITSSHIPLSLTDLSLLHIAGIFNINDLTILHSEIPNGTKAKLQDLHAKWVIDGSTRIISLDFDGMTHLEPQQALGKIAGVIRLEDWMTNGAIDFSRSKLTSNAKLQKLPTELLGLITNQNDLSTLIGPALDASIVAEMGFLGDTKGKILVDLKSERMTCSANLALDSHLHLYDRNSPIRFQGELTPNGYVALRKSLHPLRPVNFSLTESCPVMVLIKDINIPLKNHSGNSSFLDTSFTAEVLIDKLAGMDKRSQQKMNLESIRGTIASTDIAKEVRFNLDATGKTSSIHSTLISMGGTLDNGFKSDGSLNSDQLSLTFEGNVQEVPIPLLCLMVCEDPSASQKLEALIGPTLNAKVNAKLNRMNGPILVDVSGKNGKVFIDGVIQQGVLRLNKELVAQIQVTPNLGKYVLQEYLPVIGGLVGADQPIKLTIDPKNFALSLKDPSPLHASIGLGTLEMGKVRFSSDSQIAKVLSLLAPVNSDTFRVWLTPTYFTLQNGTIQMDRVDMLISEHYPIAAWGQVDLAKEKVNMTIGLTGAAISNAFGVAGIPRSYLLQLPLKGPLKNPSIDKTKAAARISSIVAQTKGGPQGMVIGKVLDIASGGLSESPPPKPTTQPLPWEEMLKDTPDNRGVVQKGVDQVVDPIQDITHGAESLIKHFFKK